MLVCLGCLLVLTVTLPCDSNLFVRQPPPPSDREAAARAAGGGVTPRARAARVGQEPGVTAPDNDGTHTASTPGPNPGPGERGHRRPAPIPDIEFRFTAARGRRHRVPPEDPSRTALEPSAPASRPRAARRPRSAVGRRATATAAEYQEYQPRNTDGLLEL